MINESIVLNALFSVNTELASYVVKLLHDNGYSLKLGKDVKEITDTYDFYKKSSYCVFEKQNEDAGTFERVSVSRGEEGSICLTGNIPLCYPYVLKIQSFIDIDDYGNEFTYRTTYKLYGRDAALKSKTLVTNIHRPKCTDLSHGEIKYYNATSSALMKNEELKDFVEPDFEVTKPNDIFPLFDYIAISKIVSEGLGRTTETNADEAEIFKPSSQGGKEKCKRFKNIFRKKKGEER